MNDVKHNQLTNAAELSGGLVSLTADTAVISNEQVSVVEQENGGLADLGTLPFVVKTPRANSKLILQNMEEVLNSVKKKHRAKHKRKRELKKLALMEAAAAANASAAAAVATTPKKPLQATQQNHDANSILKHFARTPKKNNANVAVVKVDDDDDDDGADNDNDTDDANGHGSQVDSETASTPAQKTANAFEVMMNARNKSIGGNTPGKDCLPEEQSCTPSSTHVKRKLLLQDWAERKGATKRKLDEEARALYVEQQLDKRAKRWVFLKH